MDRFIHHGYSSGVGFNVDRILDEMDGEHVMSPEEVGQHGNDQYMRVLKNKRGCNKHFKDDLLAVGWRVHYRNVLTSCPK